MVVVGYGVYTGAKEAAAAHIRGDACLVVWVDVGRCEIWPVRDLAGAR